MMDVLAADAPPVARVGPLVPAVIVQDADAAREVLVSDASSYGRPWIVRNIMSEGLGTTLFTTDGDEWLRRRRPIAPVFGSHALAGLSEVILETIEDELLSWSHSSLDDVHASMTAMTMRIACRALLGVDPVHDDLGKVVGHRFGEIVDWLGHRFTHPLAPPAAVPTPRNRQLRGARRALDEAVRDVMARRDRAGVDDSTDVMSQLLDAQKTDPSISDEQIVAECVGFLFAGHETTAATLTWALYELAMHPGHQDAVATEATQVAADVPAYERAEALEFTGRVVAETMRLYPTAIGIARVAKRRTSIAGAGIGRGTIVLVGVYPMQRSPRAWEHPNVFDPDRELPDYFGAKEPYLPFGWGPRRCLGARFARTESRLAVGAVCSRWRLSCDEGPPEPAILPSLRPARTLSIRLEAR